MKSLLTVLCASILASCASADVRDARHPTGTGCKSFPVSETLLWWEDAPLSSASFRFAVDPDTGQGPTTLVILDSGKLVNLGNPDNQPFFLAVIGDAERTCSVQMPLKACPEATAVYERLSGESLPLGFGMADPADILVLHAPTYYLEFSDGQANHNQWRFYGMDHPLQRVIDESIDSLQACIAPVRAAYDGR